MKKLGIIVDGPGDYASLKAKFRGQFRILKTDGPRGHTVAVDKIVLSSRKQIAMLRGFGCNSILLLVDFEERATAYTEFVADLRLRFQDAAFGVPVSVVMPNRMIENWFLADIEQLSKRKKFLKEKLKQKPYEGKHGKDELKKLFRPGISYNEVEHGPDMFQAIRFAIARVNSRSFDDFLSVIDDP